MSTRLHLSQYMIAWASLTWVERDVKNWSGVLNPQIESAEADLLAGLEEGVFGQTIEGQ